MDKLAETPGCLRPVIEGYQWTQATSGESGGFVYRLDKPNAPALYLKFGSGKVAADITTETMRLLWLSKLIAVPEVHQFFYSDGKAWLLTNAVSGRTAYDSLVSDPDGRSEIVRALAEFLRHLHSLPVAECPFNCDYRLRMAEAWQNLELEQVDELDFDPDHNGWNANQIWAEMSALLPLPFDHVVTHGDFSLENIFLQNRKVTGCIDVGRAGAADPYQDLAILGRNLEEFGEDLQTSLFNSYGIATADARKVKFHLCLDEFF